MRSRLLAATTSLGDTFYATATLFKLGRNIRAHYSGAHLHGAFARCGFGLLLIWCGWWLYSAWQGHLLFAERAWFQPPFFGTDFLRHIDRPARMWIGGSNPYAEKAMSDIFAYPPIVLRLFAWVGLTSPERALRVFLVVLATSAAIGAAAANNWRKHLTLHPMPYSIAIAVVLFSTPVVFCMERGNCDLLIVPCIAVAAILARRDDPTLDAIAGGLLATAIWIKLYPGLILFILLAFMKWRLFAWVIAWLALIGLADVPQLIEFREIVRIHMEWATSVARAFPAIHPWNHPLTVQWPELWKGTLLARVPGALGAGLTVSGLVLWIGWRTFQCAMRDNLLLPVLLWTVAAGTFVPQVSNDYNLAPLIIALISVWHRGSKWRYVALVALAAWWQPFGLPIPGRVVLAMKLVGLLATGFLIQRHALKLTRANDPLSETIADRV